ncbi:NifB/NifX family molybdenum-iron cluster-binding protein [Desulfotomaculum copahuensis]|uniref:Dinitrogenase iron-molybdenum cofactor biosynthesis protein n=1 Tax=Desulfotomaculum copahuensis TaxID=1838280 RepID=A0A1B7LBA6_9FIRM|nr:NifB/NifX family molybdenum-iron cluster-binding protein [Desulfotomaculum copahuensis]OAT79521.1 dinitrogenase iron-molybdenum cofactor biosynthesis protein [Desulfotomaculum copahuensis]
MQVAVCAQEGSPDAAVDPRFGRCQCLVLVNRENNYWESIANPGINSSGGAGIQTAQTLVDRRVEAVLVGRIGPKAMAVFQRAGIKVFGGITGTVRESIDLYHRGKLPLLDGANSIAHAGMGGGFKKA